MDKTSIAKKIIHFRKVKGITQETLAEETGLNVRTIQRIEAGEVDPRLYTLKSIADVLGVNLEELLPEPSQHELNQLAILHITPVAFFFFPILGNVIAPFIFWMLKREEVNGINKHGKDVLNSQLTYSVVFSVFTGMYIGMVFLPIFFPGTSIVFELFQYFPFYLIALFVLSGLIFGIIPAVNAIRVYKGKEPWRYLLKINFFK